ncbi:unnamed protein product [Microthlaspi erraticum]|uniref:Uncharacterized protein n=1 Tax=Microthlaspi erraticum TaxID=1685480 RepID=A0A6D2I584_9BRAS|nr:unnamed protein product [Microthlaspi erraticum]
MGLNYGVVYKDATLKTLKASAKGIEKAEPGKDKEPPPLETVSTSKHHQVIDKKRSGFKRHLAQDLASNKKLCVRFGRLITAIVQHLGIDIPSYEPLPKAALLDLHAFHQIHFLNRWTQNPTKFCYDKTIAPYHNYYTLQCTGKAQRRHQERHVLSTGMPANLALDRVSQLEKVVECQSRFISRLIRVVRHIAPDRLFRPSLTAREPYEPDLGEFSLTSELGSEGDDPIEEEESTSHHNT